MAPDGRLIYRRPRGKLCSLKGKELVACYNKYMKKSCLRCRHYFSTFDPQKPRGCNLYGFRSARFPNLVVKEQSGSECQGFKERPKKKEDKMDLNDPRYW